MKDIKGYEGLYAITSCGKVWSYRNQCFRKPSIDKNGYYHILLWNKSSYKSVTLHRLVAEAYIPNPDNLPEVNHKNEDKAKNFMNNLEWCTRDYNINYGTQKERAANNRKKTS